MKSKLLVSLTILMLAQVASAMTIKDGRYVGRTNEGEACTLTVNSNGGLTIGMFWRGALGDGVGFRPKKSEQTGNVLKVSGSADFFSVKAKITMANDGTPVEAAMGIGTFVQVGYDIDCENLKAQK